MVAPLATFLRITTAITLFKAFETRSRAMWNHRRGLNGTFLLLLVGVAMTFTVEAGMLEHCNGALVELIPCSDSLSGKEAAPVNGPCCMAVSELMLTPECLCYAASTAQGFDMKEILGLPRACRLHVKHVPTCEGIPIPSYIDLPETEDPALVAAIEAEIAADALGPVGFSQEELANIKEELSQHTDPDLPKDAAQILGADIPEDPLQPVGFTQEDLENIAKYISSP